MIHHLTRATRHLLFWSLITVAIALSATRIFLAGLDKYQLEWERIIRQATDVPFRIGQMEAGMRGFNPEVILREISIEADDPKHKPDMQLKEIRLGIDFLDLLMTWDVFSASRVTLVGANISLIRNEDGTLSIKGLHASDEHPLWLLRGSKYEILDSKISWQDLKRHGEVVHFDRFDLVFKNHFYNDSHEVHLVSKLPQHYGDSLRISALLKGNIFDFQDIEGQLYVEGSDLQAGALITGDLPLGLDLHSGAGDLRVWSLWRHSRPYQVAGYIQAQQLKISKEQGKPLAMDTFEGSFTWSDNDGRWRLAGYDVNIFANHLRWPDGTFYLQQDAQGNLSAIIKQLDLPAAMLLAPLVMPVENGYADWLELNPKGRLRDVSVFVSQDLQQYAARGKFEELGNQEHASMPKLQHLSGEFSVTDDYGQIILDSHNTQADIPDLFRNPIEIKRLQGAVHWWQTADAWQFFSQNLTADSADFASVSQLNLLLPKTEASPTLALRTSFGQFNDISQIPKYLPAKIMDEDAVDWLDHAFIAGRIKQGELVINGPLDQFPFSHGPGKFETVFAIENGEIQFNEDWPHLHNAYADVQFLGEDLLVAIAEGGIEQVKIDQAIVTIPGLIDSNPVYVRGQVHASIMNSLTLLQKSPLKEKIDPIAKLISSEGDTRVDLDLKIPYSEIHPDKLKANVDAHLNGVQLTLKPIDLKVTGIKGVLNFTEDLISSTRIDAHTLGYPIQGRLSSDDQATYLDIQGTTSIEQLEKQFVFLQNDSADGTFSYSARLTLPYQSMLPGLLGITSNLKGVSSDDLVGLTKNANEEKPLSLNFQFDDTVKLPLELHYSDQLQALFLIDKNRESLHSGHIVLGVGQASRYEPAGMKLDVRQPVFNLSQALAAFSASDKTKQLEVREVNIDTEQLIWQGQELGAFHSRLQHLNQSWQGNIDSTMAKGYFTIPDQRSGNNRITLDMDFLNLSAMDKFNFDAADEVVTDLPLIDIDSKRLWWREVDLGTLTLQTERLSNGIHFKKIQLHGAKSKIDLTADWLKQLTGTTTMVKGKLQADSFGELLSELAFTDNIKETSADISFKGGWRGGPHQFALDRLNGQLQMDLRNGRLSNIEPGFGRLLGIIAMEQWVKRLSLDFSDVYSQGLAFDQIKGRYKIKDGLAFTDDMTVDAVAATFYMAGFVNLADKTLDQRVAVVPNSSEAVPIAGTILDGIASMITQVVTDDYKEGYFFGSQYQLSGTWGNVEVTPLHNEDGLLKKTWRGLTDFGWLDSLTE